MKKIFIILFSMVLIPLSLFGWKMESGSTTLPVTTTGSSTWQHVDFQQSYDTVPLVFALTNEGSGYSGDRPVALRIKNITTDGFDIVQVEPQGEDGPHPEMTPIHYLAIDSGEHSLPDGTKIIAGSVDTSKYQGKNESGTKSWESVSFSSSFLDAPIVLGMIQSINNEENTLPGEISVPWMVTAIDDINTSGFKTALDMVKTNDGNITTTEKVAYLGIDEGKQGSLYDSVSCETIQYRTIATARKIKGWDDECYSQPFGVTYAANPIVVANMQTRNGGDGGWLRSCSLATDSIEVTVDEDVSTGNRTHPVKEIAGLLVFSEAFVYDSEKLMHCSQAIAEYRLDECYWLGSSTFDVADTIGGDDAESYNSSQPDQSDAIINFSGDFIATGYAQLDNSISVSGEWSYSFWMKFPLDSTDHQYSPVSGVDYYFCSGSLSGKGDFPAFALTGSDLQWAVYDENGSVTVQDLDDSINSAGWKMITFVKKSDDSTLLYIDGSYVDTIALGTDGNFMYLLTSDDNASGQTLSTKVDEIKLWDKALSLDEIKAIYDNENSGKNYTGTTRSTVTCDASIAANTWELIGIPADFRNSSNPEKTVDDIFGDDMSGTFNTDWRIYKRSYSTTDNGSSYTQLASGDNLEFGIGYWLGSKLNSTWSENGAAQVDYNSTSSACTASRCVEISLVPVVHNFDIDPDDGTGPYRYNMSGFIGKMPVDWADCRFIVDGTVMTPSDLESSDIGAKQIWLYNPNDSGANSNGYTTCDDTTPGGCKLIPYKGFFIELHGPSKGKTIKLLIPQE